MEYLSDVKNELEVFRAIILYGRNVASYKFALGQSLLELSLAGKDFVSLEELAVPFSRQVTEHIRSGKRQSTSPSSKFLYGCQLYVDGKIEEDELIAHTTSYGFKNVIDAFPNLQIGQDDQMQFYQKAVRDNRKGIVLTDSLHKMVREPQADNLTPEIEGRWNLVEASWSARNPNVLIEYDDVEQLFVANTGGSNESYLNSHLRKPVTHARKPLSGYQKGKCFYCYDDISIVSNQTNTAAVDHFFPISMQTRISASAHLNLNDIWNLVLTCKSCNGENSDSKWKHTPARQLLYDLERRNNYYIHSKHPLGQTIKQLTGESATDRRGYLNSVFALAKEVSPYEWSPKEIKGSPF